MTHLKCRASHAAPKCGHGFDGGLVETLGGDPDGVLNALCVGGPRQARSGGWRRFTSGQQFSYRSAPLASTLPTRFFHCSGPLFGMRDKSYEARVVAQGFEIWIVGNPQIRIDTQAMIDCFAEEWERLIRPPQFRFQSAQGIECNCSVGLRSTRLHPFQQLLHARSSARQSRSAKGCLPQGGHVCSGPRLNRCGAPRVNRTHHRRKRRNVDAKAW